jgi:hypothetical protein
MAMRSTLICRAGLILLTVVSGILPAAAAPAPASARETWPEKERGSFVPTRKFRSLPGRAIGILVSNVREVMANDGRSGPADAMAFSVDGNSYYWIYVPSEGRPRISNLQVRVGEKGDKIKVYPALDMASPSTVKRWGITAPYALVEVEVNDGLGAPADQSFVATSMKQLDGTSAYPLKVEKVLADLTARSHKHIAGEKKNIEAAFEEAQKKVLKGEKYTGPRTTNTLVYVTWMAKKQQLEARYRERITDGAYKFVNVGRPRPVPLPLPPGRGVRPARPVAFPPPPPPPFFRVRTGTTVTVELGGAYQVSKASTVQKTFVLPIQTSHSVQPVPPAIGGPRVPVGRPALPAKP